jgi:hypothetical protein
LSAIALIEKRWKEGEYGRNLVKESETLLSNPPLQISAILISSTKFKHRYRKKDKK